MVQEVINSSEHNFSWIDISEPEDTEMAGIAQKFHLHEELVKDCLQPDHLPKYESIENYAFIIFRIYTDREGLEADTVRELTHKIAIFYSKEFLITIHRKPVKLIDELKEHVKKNTCKSSYHLLNLLIKGCLHTFDAPSERLSKGLEYYEEQIFIRSRKVPLLKGMYYLKRKADVIRRMLILSYDIIDNIDAEKGDVNTRDTRDQYVKLHNIYDSLLENVNQLLNLYFSISSQRTSEVMRILTIFSVFFMPLTFIVGIYGMNFDFMPELRLKFGYPAVMVLMAVITFGIYIWFKRKGWL